MVAFLVSLGALLLAAAGMARHVRLRSKQRQQGQHEEPALADETDLEHGS